MNTPLGGQQSLEKPTALEAVLGTGVGNTRPWVSSDLAGISLSISLSCGDDLRRLKSICSFKG